jgi:hypothetical protein
MKRLKTTLTIIAAAGTLGMFGSIGAVHAAPGDNGQGRGGCVSGEFYGNTSNPRPSGNGVLPSQSPGPFLNTGPNQPPRNDRVRGASIGDAIQLGHDLGLTTNETFEAYALATGC